jgi:hypothetical protein
MLKWLKRLMGCDPVVHTVNIHISGTLKVDYEGRPGHPMAPSQGPIDAPTPTKIGGGMDRGTPTAEPDISPELFADTGTPEVGFGINVEEPPKGTPDQNS